jgi:hypothetical protein
MMKTARKMPMNIFVTDVKRKPRKALSPFLEMKVTRKYTWKMKEISRTIIKKSAIIACRVTVCAGCAS